MLQGVHAETIAFSTYQQARSCLLDGSRPLIGNPSDVLLLGQPPRRVHLRFRDTRENSKALSCQLELRDAERHRGPLLQVEVSFTPDGDKTRVKLRGSTARDLSPASPRQDETSRRLANEYSRALLDQIAHAIEVRAAEVHLDSSPGATSKSARPKGR